MVTSLGTNAQHYPIRKEDETIQISLIHSVHINSSLHHLPHHRMARRPPRRHLKTLVQERFYHAHVTAQVVHLARFIHRIGLDDARAVRRGIVHRAAQ